MFVLKLTDSAFKIEKEYTVKTYFDCLDKNELKENAKIRRSDFSPFLEFLKFC